jgi:hypothetical protein
MKRTLILAITATITAVAMGSIAFAHGNSDKQAATGNHMGQMLNNSGMGMVGGMGMHFTVSDSMLDIDELTKTLSLSNEQLSILSQLDVSHIMMMETLRADVQGDEAQFNHMHIMKFMSENNQLMSEHQALFQQFLDSLSEDQKATWENNAFNCH